MLDMHPEPGLNPLTLPQPTQPPTFTTNSIVHPSIGIANDSTALPSSPFPKPFFPEDYEDIITSSATTCALCCQIGHFAYECQHLNTMVGQIPKDVATAVPHLTENNTGNRRRSITPYQGTRRFVFRKSISIS